MSFQDTELWFRIRHNWKRRALILGVTAAAFLWIGRVYTVSSPDMRPALLPEEQVIVNTLAYDFRPPFSGQPLGRISNPRRGDIIVFYLPEDTGRTLAARVVGLPGEALEIKGRQVFIGQRALSEVWAHFDPDMPEEQSLGFRRVLIPPDHYFVLGDNRDQAWDSRHWFQGRGGFVPRNHIIGKAVLLTWSWNKTHMRWNRLGSVK